MLACPRGHPVAPGPGSFCPTCGTRLVEVPDDGPIPAGAPLPVFNPAAAEEYGGVDPTVAVPPAVVPLAPPPVATTRVLTEGPPRRPGPPPPPERSYGIPAAIAAGAVALVALVLVTLALVKRNDKANLVNQPPTTLSAEGTTTSTIATTTTSTTIATTTTTAPTTTTSIDPASQIATLSQAQDFVRSRGYIPNGTSGYVNTYVLKVIIGTSTTGGQKAFFFAEGRALGTDVNVPSTSVDIADQNDDTVTLEYAVYNNGATANRPSGQVPVRFHYDGQQVTALDPVPTNRNPS